MEFLGLLALAIILFYSSYPNRVEKLEKEIKKLKKQNEKEIEMSKIINDLLGKTCKITRSDGTLLLDALIVDVDTEWVKMQKTDKKNVTTVEIIRIEDIKKVEMIAN